MPDTPSDRRTAFVPARADGERLDRFLAEYFPNYSRRQLRRVIGAGLVRLNDKRARAGTTVQSGDRLEIPVLSDAVREIEQRRVEARDATRPEHEVVELHRDEDLIIVAKPAGLPVHGGAGITDETLIDVLREDILAGFGLVHRLDRGTTGAIALVRGEALRKRTVEAFGDPEGGVRKIYEAIVSGVPDEDEGVIDLPLSPPGHRGKARVDERGGKPSRTRYRVVEAFTRAARVELELETGRIHQIRVHMAAIGHPLLVDPLYAARRRILINDPRGVRPARLNRTPLHARTLSLPHPVTGETVAVDAPVPADMRYALEILRVVTGRGLKRGGLPPAQSGSEERSGSEEQADGSIDAC